MIYWPPAQPDELLISALIEVARSAQCLSLGQQPSGDATVLQYGSQALAQLRNRLVMGHMNETIIFIMDWLINTAYMTGDRSAFNIHWTAFRPAAERFIARSNDTIATIVKHRLKSWETLHDYREHIVQFRPISSGQLTDRPGSLNVPGLPSGFSQLVSDGQLALETAEISLTRDRTLGFSTSARRGTLFLSPSGKVSFPYLPHLSPRLFPSPSPS